MDCVKNNKNSIETICCFLLCSAVAFNLGYVFGYRTCMQVHQPVIGTGSSSTTDLLNDPEVRYLIKKLEAGEGQVGPR